MKITINPRRKFSPYIRRKARWSTLVVHRRGGKTFACIQDLIHHAISNPRKDPPPRYAYLAPTRSQAKDIAWLYLKNFTQKIPGIKVNEADLKITFPTNGATISLYSGESYERMRGLYLDGIVMDEDQDNDPLAWPYVIRPCLSDYKGFATRIGTPKGKNAFYNHFRNCMDDPERYGLILKASESGIIDPAELEELKNDPTMSEDAFKQEYECDFNIGRPGAIYAKEIEEARNAKRVTEFEPDGQALVHTTSDIGSAANTSFIYWQRVALQWRIIDHDRGKVFKTVGARVAHMKAKGYNYGSHCLPHDAAAEKVEGISYQQLLEQAGLSNIKIIPRTRDVNASIDRMHTMMPNIYYRESTTGELLEALENYHRKESNTREGYIEDKIVHDWTSHDADAFRYLGEAEQHGLLGEGDVRRNPNTERKRSSRVIIGRGAGMRRR